MLFGVFYSSFSLAKLGFCPEAIEAFHREHLLSIQSAKIYVLPPKSKRYVIGSLVSFGGNNRVLALGGAHTQHAHLELALFNLKKRNPILTGFHYEWLGELTLENSLEVPAVGVITAANEISGLYFRKYKDSETHSNHVSALSSALKGLNGLVHANAKFYSYDLHFRVLFA